MFQGLDIKKANYLSLLYRERNGAWLEVKKGGSFCMIGAISGDFLKLVSRKRRIFPLFQSFGCSKLQ